jgi:hypothetical protein
MEVPTTIPLIDRSMAVIVIGCEEPSELVTFQVTTCSKLSLHLTLPETVALWAAAGIAGRIPMSAEASTAAMTKI